MIRKKNRRKKKKTKKKKKPFFRKWGGGGGGGGAPKLPLYLPVSFAQITKIRWANFGILLARR